MTNFIGIDISKRDFHVCFTEEKPIIRFTNDRQGIRNLLSALKKDNMKPEDTVIGMESTGIYHLLSALMCSRVGYPVHIINPLLTKKQSQTVLRNVKNDKKDARLIRYCTMSGMGYPFSETKDTLTLKARVRQRNYLVALNTKLKLRQQAIEHVESCINETVTTANQDLQNVIAALLKSMNKELAESKKECQQLLRSIPGIGLQTASCLISEIGDISRFSSSKKLTAFIGLDSRVHQSGTSVNGKGYITKRGNKLLRTYLFNAASVAVQRPNIFYDYFQKKRSEGKPYRVAMCAVMHKMVHVIHAVWTRGTPFVNEKG
jgi:transposase